MPRFSVIIPAYNNADYLPDCLESIISQTYTNWEAVVVNDASPDNTRDIVLDYASKDNRIVLADRPTNGGRHLARKFGVERATGEYLLFLDSDDTLVDNSVLARLSYRVDYAPADIIRFGLLAVATNGTTDQTIKGFTEWSNGSSGMLKGADIIRAPFDASEGYKIPWNITHRLFKHALITKAFELSPNERMERAEDAVEYFIAASMAETETDATDIIGYKYNLGAGATNSSEIDLDRFVYEAEEHRRSYQCVEQYALNTENPVLITCAEGLKTRVIESVAAILERVEASQKAQAAQSLSDIIGKSEAATELFRLLRDYAYLLLKQHRAPQPDDKLFMLHDLATSAYDPNDASIQGQRCTQMRALALDNYQSALELMKLADYEGQPIRIFVSAHKRTDLFESKILQPIQVGAERAKWKFENMLMDNTGENISELNPMYCELTAQYWAWKNVSCEYVGFCHYRRYFNFSDTRFKENAFGEIIDKKIDAKSQAKYALDDASIRKAIQGYDVVTTEFKDLRDYPGKFTTPIEHWHEAPKLVDDDLISALAILVDMHPEYIPTIEAYVNGHTTCFCNMFIMRKALFDDYCAWLFPMLERFVETCDMTYYSKETLRTPGHLSERLLNIYLMHNASRLGWKTKQVQCVHFERTDPAYRLQPLSSAVTKNKPVVPVVLAADTNYAPMIATTVASMLKNASTDYHYDINVFTGDFDWNKFCVMRDFFQKKHPNATLSMLNVSDNIKAYELSTNNAHIGIETYFRFLIQDLLPHYDKVLYLDSDLIIQDDVSKLFQTELGDNLIAAVRDIDFAGNVSMKDGKRAQYARTVLGMNNPYDYFQAGVLVLNTRTLRETVSVSTWLAEASDTRYIYNDQDILNKYCEGRVVFLDASWNVMIDCEGRIGNVFSFAPAFMVDDFNRARTEEKIIHYAGCQKPWSTTKCDRQEIYWSYAREIPFYEDLLRRLVGGAGGRGRKVIDYTDKTLDEESPLRAVIDPLLPENSARREAVRHVVLKVKSLR